MDDKNLELINQNLALLFSNIQNSLFQIPNKGFNNFKNEMEMEIKKYEDYEFTHCIAYKMAARNSDVIKLTNIAENFKGFF